MKPLGMTDRQFDVHQARLLKILKMALVETPGNKILAELIAEIEAELQRP